MSRAKYVEDNTTISEHRLRNRDLRQKYYNTHAPKQKRLVDSAHKKATQQKPVPSKPVKEIPASKFIICKDCGDKFEFDLNEQYSFSHRGWKNPIRCVPCRKKNKEKRDALDKPCSPSENPQHMHNNKSREPKFYAYDKNLATRNSLSRSNSIVEREPRGEDEDDSVYAEPPDWIVARTRSYKCEVKKWKRLPLGKDAMNSN